MGMLACLFTWSITIRRFVMQKVGNTTVAHKSVMRTLYDLLDETYNNIAAALDKNLNTDVFVPMVPLVHAISIMSFSLLLLGLGMDSCKSDFEEYGYFVYLGMTLVIMVLYTIRNTRQGHGFLPSLLAAFAMYIAGALAMITCLLFAVFSFLAINAVITAISNLFRKLFGD